MGGDYVVRPSRRETSPKRVIQDRKTYCSGKDVWVKQTPVIVEHDLQWRGEGATEVLPDDPLLESKRLATLLATAPRAPSTMRTMRRRRAGRLIRGGAGAPAPAAISVISALS